jgi:hypothetical protein
MRVLDVFVSTAITIYFFLLSSLFILIYVFLLVFFVLFFVLFFLFFLSTCFNVRSKSENGRATRWRYIVEKVVVVVVPGCPPLSSAAGWTLYDEAPYWIDPAVTCYITVLCTHIQLPN